MHFAASDIPTMRAVVAQNDFEILRTLWLGGLLCISHMVIVRQVRNAKGVGDWFLPLQHCSESSVLAWPVRITSLGNFETLELDNAHTKPIFIQVYCLDSWQARPIDALSPMGEFAKHFKAIKTSGFARTRIVVVGPPISLVNAAAMKAFWKLPPTFLRKLADYVGISIPAGASAFTILYNMVSECLGCNEAKTLEILSERLGSGSGDGADFGYNDIMELDEAAACLDQNDRQDLKDCQQKSEKIAKEHTATVTEWIQKKSTLRAKTGGSSSRPGRSRGGSSSSCALSLPSCSLEQVSLKPFCSPGGYIWKGNNARTWNGHYRPFPRQSATWSVYGMRGSAIRILRYLWERHAVVNDLKMPDDCLVENLFTDAAPVPEV